MIYPYMNTLNLSVDNALTSQQILHQLITKMNELVEYINTLETTFIKDANKYTDDKFKDINNVIAKGDYELQEQIISITQDLVKIRTEIKTETDKAILKAREYTDISTELIEEKIKTLSARVEDVLEESKIYTDDNIRIVNREIELLDDKLMKLASNSFASVSVLDGEIKKNTDCFFDMLHVFQTRNGVTLDDIIALMMYTSNSNLEGDDKLVATNMTDMLTFATGTSTQYFPNVYELGDYNTGAFNKLNTTAGMVKPTWANILSCGINAIYGLGKAREDGSVKPLGYGLTMYNAYYNRNATEGISFSSDVTGNTFKPFDITKQ